MKKTTIIEIITVLYVILFLYTGISKITEYSVFKEQIANSPLLAPIATPAAMLLPWIEFTVVILLIIPRWRLKGFYLSLFLMTIFTVYIIGIISFSDNLPCSCGGVLAQLSWNQHIVFNSLFIALALVGCIMEKRIKRTHMLQSSIAASPIP
jgi:uncharacterized membrane protein YphA (DoxX/SURF4 family)